MNHAFGFTPASTTPNAEELARARRMQSLLALLSLYAGLLLLVVVLSDGADIGCILGGIAAHVFYAAHRTATAWRDAAWLEEARGKLALRARLVG